MNCSLLVVLEKDLGSFQFVPQIAIATGVLTSNGGGRATNHFGGLDTWRQGAIAGCSGRGAISGCHCSVRVTSGRGAIAGAIVVWYGGRVATNFGGVDWCHCWVPLHGAIVMCYG